MRDSREGGLVGSVLAVGREAEILDWGGDRVLKLFFAADERQVAREWSGSQRALAAGVPGPRAIERLTIDGRSGIVFERVDGPTLLDLASAKPWTMLRFAHDLAALHARIHDAAADGLPSAEDDLRDLIQDASLVDEPLSRRALARLSGLAGGSSLNHGDLHPGNVIVTVNGPRVIDWSGAGSGTAEGDVARTMVLLRWATPPQTSTALQRGLLQLARATFARAYLRAYCRLTRRDPARVGQWMLPAVVARLALDMPGERTGLLAEARRLP